MHRTFGVFIFRLAKFALPFFPSNVNVCFCGLITRYGSAPPNKIPCLFSLWVSAFDELLATLVDDSSFFLQCSTYFNLSNVINFLVNDTNNCVDSLRSEGCRTWGWWRKPFYNYSLLGCLLCLKVQQKLHPRHSESRFFCSFCLYLFP